MQGLLELLVADVVWGGVLWNAKLLMANSTPQEGCLQGEKSGPDCGKNHNHRYVIFPGGAKTKNQESSDAAKTNEVEKRGSFLRHIFMHFSRNVPLFVQGGLNLTHFKAGMSRFSSLHDDRGNQVRKNAKGEANGENGSFPEEEPCKKNRGNEEDEGHGKMVRHDVDVFGLKKAGIDAHSIRLA